MRTSTTPAIPYGKKLLAINELRPLCRKSHLLLLTKRAGAKALPEAGRVVCIVRVLSPHAATKQRNKQCA
jgi:hypothetical protein